MERRQVLKTLAVGTAAAAVAAPATFSLTETDADAKLLGYGPANGPMGTGMYVDMSTAQQMSTFSIASNLVTCGVGTFGVGQLNLSGPFSMLMYSTSIATYTHDQATRTITATGRMRSITMIAAGLVTENVEHDFIAIATNNAGAGTDRFDVHFVTPFWTPSRQPLATPSSVRPGWARFGGNVAKALLTNMPLGGVNA
jgi:TAT (twin-arginine translocation) pathway signal sequence